MEYNLVNWADGMKISKIHFQQTENHFIETICDIQAIQLTNNNYGLLPAYGPDKSSSEIEISQHVTGNVEIRLRRCNAVTLGGCRINYNPASGGMVYAHEFNTVKEDNDKNSQSWDVIITVDPFKRTPTGTPDEDEMPPRHPDSVTTYKLSIVPQGNVQSDQMGIHHLIIGRVRQRNGKYEVDDNYIPPCTCMTSHPDLIYYYETFGKAFSEIERCAKIIIGKIQNKTQSSVLSSNINSLCRDIIRYISEIYFSYRNQGRYYAPVDVVNFIATLAHVFYASLIFINKNEKEEMLKYFYEWSDITPGNFESMLSSTLDAIYEHNNIRGTMIQMQNFIETVKMLWQTLSTLEYIGQHKDNIVVSERIHNPSSVKTKSSGWSILD